MTNGTNVIGLKGTPKEREGKWSSMVLLREVLKEDKNNPKKKEAYRKQKNIYNYILEDYVSN